MRFKVPRPTIRHFIIGLFVAWAVLLAFSDMHAVARACAAAFALVLAGITWRTDLAAEHASEALAIAGALLLGTGKEFYVIAGILTLPLVLKYTGRAWTGMQKSILEEAR